MKTLGAALLLMTCGAAWAQPVETPSPSPSPTPEPTLLRAEEAAPAPARSRRSMPNQYRDGVSGSTPGAHALRVFASAGVHAFYGEGWNEDAAAPGEDPPKTDDYVGGGLRIGAAWEFTPSIAAVAQAGGHQGRHTFGKDADPEPLSVTYGLYYAAAGARWQTKPSRFGFYVEGGGGFAMGRVIVTRPNATNDEAEEKSYPTFAGYGALGTTMHVAPGVDVFIEARGMTAPHGADSFTSEKELDLGGLTGTAGLSLRL